MKAKTTPAKPKNKDKYKVTNWKAYNQSLRNRGNITIWMETDMASKWSYSGTQKRGGKMIYSNTAIEFCYIIRCSYGLAYRQTEGFVLGLFELLKYPLPVPSYTQIQRRARRLPCKLKKYMQTKEDIHIVIDSTGIKVYGEGEWKVKKHGADKHRTWRKLHIASDAETLQIENVLITGNDVDDSQAGKEVIDGIFASIASCAGDGAYDTHKFRKHLPETTIQLIPPRNNAVVSKEKDSALRQRDAAIERIKEIGRKEWKKETGYHKRSLSEVNMFR